jgi:hypothetical protein
VRLDDLQGETGRDRGVEGVAPLLEDGHAGRRGQPMCGADDAECALDLGPGGEHDERFPLSHDTSGAILTALDKGEKPGNVSVAANRFFLPGVSVLSKERGRTI